MPVGLHVESRAIFDGGLGFQPVVHVSLYRQDACTVFSALLSPFQQFSYPLSVWSGEG